MARSTGETLLISYVAHLDDLANACLGLVFPGEAGVWHDQIICLDATTPTYGGARNERLVELRDDLSVSLLQAALLERGRPIQIHIDE